jgi:internalin A
LYLSNNRITDIAGVKNLTKLWSLYLDGNTAIASLQPVSGLKSLSTLDLKKTQVKDLTPLAGLTSLHYLFLDSTPVTDLKPLIAACEKDAAGEKRFAPFLTVSLAGTPAAKGAGAAELKKHIHTVMLQSAVASSAQKKKN